MGSYFRRGLTLKRGLAFETIQYLTNTFCAQSCTPVFYVDILLVLISTFISGITARISGFPDFKLRILIDNTYFEKYLYTSLLLDSDMHT